MISEAAERNKAAILGVLRECLGERPLTLLEIGSGTGQHAAYFSRHLPHVTWQPSDFGRYLPLVSAYVAQHPQPNLRAPIELNVDAFVDVEQVDVMFSANTLHIMSWDSARQFLREAGAQLAPGGQLLVYGPFHVGGRATSESNARFDLALRSELPHMGIRHREAVCIEADRAGLSLQRVHTMPANNQLLQFERRVRTSAASHVDAAVVRLGSGYSIRPAVQADRDKVIDIVRSVLHEFAMHWDPQGADAELMSMPGSYSDAGGVCLVVVDNDDSIVGVLGMMPVSDQMVELRKMYLLPSTRGHGVGRCLVEYAINWARAAGFAQIELETAAALKAAIALYQKMGFQPMGAATCQTACEFRLRLNLNDIQMGGQ